MLFVCLYVLYYIGKKQNQFYSIDSLYIKYRVFFYYIDHYFPYYKIDIIFKCYKNYKSQPITTFQTNMSFQPTEQDLIITVSTDSALLDEVQKAIMENPQKQKKIRFIVRKRVVLPTMGSDEQYVEFQEKMKALKFHNVWFFKQASSQKHTRTRFVSESVEGWERLTLGSKGTEPIFTNQQGLRKTSSFMNWLCKNKTDYFKLYELGDPMIPQNQGGLKWQDIVEHIYNSGEMEEVRKKNGYNPKLKQELFFPSGKTDSGRSVSQFLLRLWFIVNKC